MREEIIAIINSALVAGGTYPQGDHVLATLEAAGFRVVGNANAGSQRN
jgi:hypothetical protein